MTMIPADYELDLASDREVRVFEIKQHGQTLQGTIFNRRLYGLTGVWQLRDRTAVYQTALNLGENGLKPLITTDLESYRLWVSISQESSLDYHPTALLGYLYQAA